MAPISPAARPWVIRGAAVQARQQRDQLVAGVGGDVERREVQPVLRRRGDAGLVRAVERDDVVGCGGLALAAAAGERQRDRPGGGDPRARERRRDRLTGPPPR